MIHGKRLSDREVQVLRLWCIGRNCKQIGTELGISPHTVESYLAKIHAKSDRHDKIMLFRWAVENGYVDPPRVHRHEPTHV